MNLSILQMFIEVIRQGSFAAVARERNIDPSSVSRSISSLEKELGVRLFQRTTRKLAPTEAGTLYFNRLEPIMEEMERAMELATEISGQPKGIVRVTASVSFGVKCIVPFLAEFEAMYPELSVELVLTDSKLDLVGERIDLAIRLGKLEDSSLVGQRLMTTHYAVYASPNYLKQKGELHQPEDVSQHDCLLFPFRGFNSHWIFKNSQNELTRVAVKGRTIISNAIGLQECAIAGMGLALLPNWLTIQDLEAGKLTKVLPGYEVSALNFQASAWLVYPSKSYVPLKVKVFVSFLKKNMTNFC